MFALGRKENQMAKNRVKQRAHLNCGMTKEERLMMEAAQRDAAQAKKEQRHREELLDRRDFCGIKDPTPYQAVKNIVNQQKQKQKV